MANKQFDLSVIFRVIDKATQPIRKIGSSLKKLGSPVKRLIKSFRKLGKVVKKAGDRMIAIGKAMIIKVAAPLMLLSFLAVRTSLSFETAFTGIRKTVDATEPQFEKLKIQLMALARELGIATEKIFALAEGAGQLNIERKNIAKFSEIMAKLGIAAPVLEMEAAAFQIAQFANVTQMSQKDFDRFAATLVYLGNNSATVENRILNMTERLASAASGAGMVHSEILGLATALSQLGLRPEAGGTAISQVINEITKQVALGGKKLKGWAVLSGFKQADEFAKLWKEDAVKGLMLLIEGLAGLKEKGIEAVVVLDDLGMDGRRVSDALRRAAGNNKLFNKTIKDGNRAWKDNIALNEEVNKRMKDAQKQFDKVKENARIMAAAFGDEVVPTIVKFVKKLDPLITQLRELRSETKQMIWIIGGGAIGLVGAFIGLGFTAKLLGIALAGLTPMTLAITGALVGLGALVFSVWRNFDDLKEILTNLWDNPMAELELWKDAFKLMAVDLAKFLSTPFISAWKANWEAWSKYVIEKTDEVIVKLKEAKEIFKSLIPGFMRLEGDRKEEALKEAEKLGLKETIENLLGKKEPVGLKRFKVIDPRKQEDLVSLKRFKVIDERRKESLADAVKRVMTENKSEIKVEIEVTAEPGTLAKVKKVETTGNVKTSVTSIGYVGPLGAMP